MSKFALSQRSLDRMDGVHDDLKRVALRAIQITKVDFGIPETGGVRRVETQQDLFKRGLSQRDGINQRSNHQDGIALDVFAYVDGAGSWEPEHLAQIAAAFLQAAIELGVRIRWGGLFYSFIDMPHFELIE